MPAESLVKVVRRIQDDSQGEILHKKKDQIREAVRHIRLKESPYAAQRAVGNHQRNDRPILQITPRSDQRIDGVPKFQVEQDPCRRNH